MSTVRNTTESTLKRQLFGGRLEYEPPQKKAKQNRASKGEQPEEEEAAWVDSEDEELTIDVNKNRKLRHLRSEFDETQLNATEYIKRQRKHYQASLQCDWTKQDSEDEDDDDAKKSEAHASSGDSSKLEMHQRSLRMTKRSKVMIENGNIEFSVIGNINSKTKHSSVVTVCEFSSNGKVLMSAGLDKTLCLYSMDGSKRNDLIKRVFINDLPVRCARFTCDAQQLIISGRRFFMYHFDLLRFKLNRINKVIGRDERSWEMFECSPNNLYIVFVGVRGSLVVVSQNTKKPVKTISISHPIVSLKFDPRDPDSLYILTQNATVYVYDMNSFRCKRRVMFDGVVKATCFDIHSALNVLAIGCSSGVLSVYHFDFDGESKKIANQTLLMDNDHVEDGAGASAGERQSVSSTSAAVEPIYSMDNLVTCVHGVKFNHDGQLLLYWSKTKKQAIRLVHVQTGKVYSNWPKDRGLNFVHKATFSPNSGYLAIGNDLGYVKLIRLHFFGTL